MTGYVAISFCTKSRCCYELLYVVILLSITFSPSVKNNFNQLLDYVLYHIGRLGKLVRLFQLTEEFCNQQQQLLKLSHIHVGFLIGLNITVCLH